MFKPKLPTLSPQRLTIIKILLHQFIIDGKPVDEIATYGEMLIFDALVFRENKRVQIICSTQYGKTLFVALACIIISCVQNEIVAVVAPSADKAKLTMRYFVEHLGDNPDFIARLEKNTKLERLKQEDSKSRIILNNGGGIFVVSAQEKNSNKSIESAMGLGAKIVIGDEYCLISDENEATIFRMIAGKGKDGTYIKVGNPFYSASPHSHFEKSWNDPRYKKIFIDDRIALAEGRYTQEFIDEAKEKPLYSILFKCEFPSKEEMDKDGYRQLILREQLKTLPIGEIKTRFNNLVKEEKEKGLKVIPIKLGVDIGGGGDKSVFVLRKGKLAFRVKSLNTRDTMVNVSTTEELIKEFNINPEDIAIDDIGIGRGVCDRLIELGYGINSVSVGMPAEDRDVYANIKAELWWRLKDWITSGGILEDETDFLQVLWIRWKVQSGEKKIILEPKEMVRKRQKQSPDTADALVLTFYQPKFIGWL